MVEYKACKKCVMDSSDSEISFNEKGVCKHCERYDFLKDKKVFKKDEGKNKLEYILKNIKDKGKNQKYDCVVGVSGGVDSTYVVYLAKKYGLRPLAVHLDNGWNTKIATKNIIKILRKNGVELYTYVIDWEEFKDLQRSYLKASVIDIEAITDHAIKGALFKVAAEKNIKFILTGVNFITEGVMPKNWGHNKNDYINIIDIHKKFGSVPLKTFPLLTLKKRIQYQIFKNIRMIEVLNYISYNKEKIKAFLSKEFGWEPYEGKHGESLFTSFYQTYILPQKFGVDKRKPHLSALICAGEISRDDALNELKKPLYTQENLKKDKEYVAKKLGFTEKEFEDIMKLPVQKHGDYKSADKFLRKIQSGYKFLSGR